MSGSILLRFVFGIICCYETPCRALERACVRACRDPVFVILHVFTEKKKSSANVNGVITQLENVQCRGNVLQVKKGTCKYSFQKFICQLKGY
jgi:hypothetical protein